MTASIEYYVTMTVIAMSGWGQAEGKKNKLVFECVDKLAALTVRDNAIARKDQSYVSIRTTKPSYSKTNYFTQFKNKEDYPSWYEPNYFSPSN